MVTLRTVPEPWTHPVLKSKVLPNSINMKHQSLQKSSGLSGEICEHDRPAVPHLEGCAAHVRIGCFGRAGRKE